MTSLPTSIRLKKALVSSLTAPFGLVSLCAALACGAKDAGSPGPASPEASPGAAEGAGANVGAAATPQAPSAPPATPRALPEFCGDVSNAPPLDPGARATHLRDGFVFVEGPVWSSTKNAFFFSEMDFDHQGKNGPPSKIHKLTLPSSIEVFIPESGSNGLAIDDQGLVAATHDTQTLSRFNLDTKERSVFVADYQGKHFNSPNDIALHSQGHVYFSDPDWQIGERPNETLVTGVYWRKPSGEVVLIDGSLDKPNGVTLSPDETHLYVGSASNVVQIYDVLADGNVTNRRVFADVKEPDGMAVDCAGRLYVASHPVGDVLVFAPEGKLLSVIKVAPRVTNVAFGGADRRTVLITAGTGLYTVHSEIPGFPY
jgi:gluconolactonase